LTESFENKMSSYACSLKNPYPAYQISLHVGFD